MKYRLLGLVLLGHFFIVCTSASKIPVNKIFGPGKLSAWLVLYAYVTGAGNHFGFFAPGVLSQFQVDYELSKDGKRIDSGRVNSDNPETTFRYHNIVQQFWNTDKKPELRRALAASLAGRLLAGAPKADEARLAVNAYVLPSMAQYRAGVRPAWENYYAGTFQREEARLR